MILGVMNILRNLIIITLLITTNAKAEFKTITKKEFIDRNIKALEKRFDLVDTNKDGKLSKEEIENFKKKQNTKK